MNAKLAEQLGVISTTALTDESCWSDEDEKTKKAIAEACEIAAKQGETSYTRYFTGRNEIMSQYNHAGFVSLKIRNYFEQQGLTVTTKPGRCIECNAHSIYNCDCSSPIWCNDCVVFEWRLQ